MEALRQDDPRHFGRFTVLARFHEGASAVQYVARNTASGEVAVITAARPALAALPAFRRLFRAEARTAGRLSGGWVTPPLDAGEEPDSSANGPEPLWTATAYVPALPLAEAVGIAGPLPERALRILGAGIAEVLSRMHAAGSVLQGLAPGTVLLAGDGPRLTAFGPLGAAASAEAGPGGRLSVRLGYLTPEQIQGEEVSAASDLFVLGLLLAYAATGTTPFAKGPAEEAARRIAEDRPELDAVPEPLRELIASCLSKDPAGRPTAGTVAAELALEGAAGLARGGWLPERLAAAVADQKARVLALEVPEETEATGDRPDGTGAAGASGLADAAAGSGAVDSTEAQDRAAVPDDASAAPEDARPEDPRPAPEPEDTGSPAAPAAAPAPGQPAAAPASDDGDTSADRGTTRFLNTGPRPPQNDRATTQLALPHELTAAPAPAPASHPLPPAASGSAQPSGRTRGGPAPYPAAALPPGPAGPGSPGGGPMVSLPLPPAPAPAPDPATSRRTLLTIAAAAVGGLVVGGGSVAALGSGDTPAATDDKPAPKPRPTLPGQAPEPRWIYAHPASESSPLTTAVWRDRLLVLTSESQASAVDLRTGKRLWQRADAAKGQAAVAAGDLCFVASPTEFLWLSPKDGTVVHRVRHTDGFTDLPDIDVGPMAGSSGPVIWFTGSHTVTVKAPKPKKGKKKAEDKEVVQAYFFAYDIVQRKELWRTPVPAGRAPGTPVHRVIAERSADLLVRQVSSSMTAAEVKAAKGKGSVRSFDQKTGKLLWTKRYGTASPVAGIAGDEEGALYTAVGTDLQAFETDTTKPLWRVEGSAGSAFGTPLIAGPLIHTTERSRLVGAVDRESGRLVWRRSTEVPGIGNAPSLTLSSSEKTLITADAVQVTAFSAADGERLWKFQDVGSADPKGPTVSAQYRALTFKETVVVQRDRSFYAFPVA